MAAEFRKDVRRDVPSGRGRVDLRTAVEREHSSERKLKMLARYAYVGAVDADRLPCAFRTIGDEIEVSANRGIPYDPLVRADRSMVLGCGGALFRLRIAIQHVGYLPIVRTFPDPLEADRLAVIRLGPRREPPDMVEAMFERMHVAESASGNVESEGEGEGETPMLDMDALRLDARREGSTVKAVRMRDDGTPAEVIDQSSLSPHEQNVFIFVASSRDLTPDHLNAGQALERILLGPAGHSLRVDYATELLNDQEMRLRLRELIGAWPQAALSGV